MFLPRAAPGDLVEASVKAGGSPLRGHLLRVIEPGPGRVEAACPLAGTCGGCDLMHLSPEAQRAAHRGIVEGALRHVAGIGALPEIVTHAAAPPLGYRTRARLHARAHRGRAEIGYRAPASRDLVPVDRCPVLAPELDALLAEIPALLEGAHGTGDVSISRALAPSAQPVTAAAPRHVPVVDILWRGALPAPLWSRLDERVSSGRWAGARAWLEGASTPATFGDPRPVVEGADGRPLVLAAGGFAQPSDEAASVLARRVADLTRKGGDIGALVELYAGSGTLSILLAPLAGRFTAVESHEESARTARHNLEARGLEASVVVADADSHDLGRAAAVVLDPPRTGAPGAVRRIAASRAGAVVYVACDPVTLARDLVVLVTAGFTVTDVETVELFPQTSHVETVVRLVRSR